MAKTTVVRTNKLFTMYRTVARRRGRGSNFQWNVKAKYTITYAGGEYKGIPVKVFKTLDEADKEWIYLMLKHL